MSDADTGTETAIMFDDLAAMLASCPENSRGARDRALLSVGWFGGLKVGQALSLTGDQVTIDKAGIVIAIDGKPGLCIPRYDAEWDPVSAVSVWMEILAGGGWVEQLGLWPKISTGGRVWSESSISQDRANDLLRELLTGSDLDGLRFGDLRKGMSAEAKERGVEDSAIWRHLGVKTNLVGARTGKWDDALRIPDIDR